MKKIRIRWVFCFYFLTGTIVEAQVIDINVDTLFHESLDQVRGLSENPEILPLKYPKVYWFDSYKLPIGDVALAKIKKGITSNTSGSKNGATVNRIEYKFSAEVKNNQDNAIAEVKGKVEILNEYLMTSGGILDDVLNIETETFGGNICYDRSLSAIIKIKDKNQQEWMMEVRSSGEGSDFKLEEGFLTCGSRLIRIQLDEDQVPDDLISSDYPNLDFRRYVSLNYDFSEEGKIIGTLQRKGENALILERDLDPTTKLILMAAMVVVEK